MVKRKENRQTSLDHRDRKRRGQMMMVTRNRRRIDTRTKKMTKIRTRTKKKEAIPRKKTKKKKVMKRKTTAKKKKTSPSPTSPATNAPT